MKSTKTGSQTLQWTIVTAAGLLLACGGCTELGDEFRAAAGPDLQAGIAQVLTGAVDGAFAVFEPGKNGTGSTSDSTGTSDGTNG